MAETPYPNNSHTARERKPEGSSPPDKKLEKVVSGEAKTRKKSEVKKFANIFVPEDVENVKSYILVDVIVPGIKNAIADAVSIMLFGEAGRLGGRSGKGSRASYQRYYDDRRDDRREYAINQYQIVSVADLYDLAGITCRSYTANKYGWTDLRSAKVVRTRDGYILQLPRTVQIN